MTPDQWLERLTAAMDNRADRLARLRSYLDGNAPLPEGADGCRDAYKKFQRKARTNFGELVVDAVAERMILSGFRVGGANEDDDDARAIVRRNRLQVGSVDVHRDMLGLATGYTITQLDQAGRAVVSCERPEQVITEHDARRPDMVRAGLKVYRDSTLGLDVAYLHLPGEVHTYARELTPELLPLRIAGDWQHAGAEESGISVVPVVPFVNRGGLGEFETHVDVLDRINWLVLQELVTVAMQAYRQRATKGNLPEHDDDGNEIDYDEMFRPGPGSLWQLPEGIELWESQPIDVAGILQPADKALRHFAAVTRTPMSTLMPGGENQTAEGAAFAREGLMFKAQDRIARAGASWATTMGIALALERGLGDPVDDVEALWLPPERQSLAERADAATKAQDLPWRTRMTDIWQFSADRVDDMESERAADLLQASLLMQPQPPVSRGEQPA